MEVVPIQCKED